MHYVIIAAGEGSRLREEGVSQPKPLVAIGGCPMLGRLVSIMMQCRAESISLIVNQQMTDVQAYARELMNDCPILRLKVKSTPSSMHSFAEIADMIPEGRFCMTTVDTIFRPDDFARYVGRFEQMQEGDGLFVVTPFIDDEKPLYVAADTEHRITAFLDRRDEMPDDAGMLVSGGIYGLDTRTALPVLHRCMSQGKARMRNFQRSLLEEGLDIRAYVMDKVFDIDHASDIEKANDYLSACNVRKALLVTRGTEFSPGENTANDRAILTAVGTELRQMGYEVTIADETTFSPDAAKDADVVLHMARRMTVLMRMARIGVRVINHPRSVLTVATSREQTFSKLQEAGIGVPLWWAYDPEEDEMFQCEEHLQALLPGWVKGTRTTGAVKGDVSYVTSPLEADSRVMMLAAERVPDIVVMRHVEGDLIKVYCVPQAGFMHWCYPQEQGHSKFGDEQHNAMPCHYPVDEALLLSTATRIAEALELEVFGFDCILDSQGRLTVIDVNDWPSFYPCRTEAARAIAKLMKITIIE